jgi:hypothetical protein
MLKAQESNLQHAEDGKTSTQYMPSTNKAENAVSSAGLCVVAVHPVPKNSLLVSVSLFECENNRALKPPLIEALLK